MQACISAECLYRFIQVFHHLFSHCPRRCTPVICSSHGLAGRLERGKNPAIPPSISYKFPLPIATRSASNPTLMHMYPVFVQCQKERARASQPAKYANPPNSSYTHPQPSSSSSSSSQSHSFFIQLRLKSLTSHPHPSAHASSTACSSCSTPPCTSPCSWCSRSIRPGTRRSRGSGCSGRSSVR
jgi:hypothetical protein